MNLHRIAGRLPRPDRPQRWRVGLWCLWSSAVPYLATVAATMDICNACAKPW